MMQTKINDSRLEQLKELLLILASEIDDRPGARDMASLSKQYRETLAEIAELEGENNEGDDIAALLDQRAADGKSGAVRKSRA